jgi:hypothetical protein
MDPLNLSLIRPGAKKGDSAKPDQNGFGSSTRNISVARLALGWVAISGFLMGIPTSLHSQTPADDLAAQVRSQGYQCDQSVTAQRDVSLSKPDSAVWTLKCRNASYRVRLVPDMSAHVEKLKK